MVVNDKVIEYINQFPNYLSSEAFFTHFKKTDYDTFHSIHYSAMEWQNGYNGDIRGSFLERIKNNRVKDISIADWTYTITQHLTFQSINKNIILYRGVGLRENVYQKVLQQKKITTNSLSSFSLLPDTAREFAEFRSLRYTSDEDDIRGLAFSIQAGTKDILMTYLDWMTSEDFQGQEEYVLINENERKYPITILR